MEERTPGDEVLSHYLCLFRYGGAQFKYFMAPDALVDWFGRPIYGSHRISDLMRYHVHMQYEHINFDVAKDCGAIECKPCHMKTKIRSKREVDPISSLNKVIGITSLKSRADSDDEMDLESKKSMSDNSTLTMCTSSPDTVAKKEVPDSDEDCDDVDEDVSKAKRLKRCSPSTQSCSQTKKDEIPDKIRTLLDDTSDEEDEPTKPEALDAKGAFSPLHYIETYGRLRARNFAGHQGHGKAYACSHFKYKDAGEVRIRMSYRRRLSDNTIEYVLIIYEHLRNLDEKPADVRLTRRNLMKEFAAAAIEEAAEVREAAIAVEATAGNNSVNVEEEETASDVATGKTTAENEPSGFLRSEPSSTSGSDDPLFLTEALTSLSYHMRTPDKRGPIPPPTPKRRPHTLPYSSSKYGVRNQSPSLGKAKGKSAVARNLRL